MYWYVQNSYYSIRVKKEWSRDGTGVSFGGFDTIKVTHAHTHTYLLTRTHMVTHTHTHMVTHTHIWLHTHTHMVTHTHTHTHTTRFFKHVKVT